VTALLEVVDVGKGFGGIQALDGVSLEVSAGESVGLIGPNGAGKTTLFDCITGVRRSDTGEIRFDGRRIDDLAPYRRARLGIGRTFQRIELFAGMTGRDHLIVAAREHSAKGRLWKDLLWRGAPAADEVERVDKMIDELGLETFADAAIESLSLGQGRLVELGRALMIEPRLLLLDEPSSGLDSRESAVLAGVLNDLRHRRDIAVLVVEHDLDVVRAVAERAYVIDFGRMIASGTLGDVLADSGVRTAYLGEGA
jgi:branched-chain amino acid transport system ATP-binding protein